MKKILCLLLCNIALSAYAKAIEVNINPENRQQKIEYFTASDAWSTQYVGDYWEDFLKDKIARLLFSQNFDEAGNPEGIGLSLWRVNLGGGSLEGDDSELQFKWRAARSFINPKNGKIDWNRCDGLKYFMKKAREFGCEKFLLFSNTPPISMTKNGSFRKTEKDFKSNLKDDCYDYFAEYLAECVNYFSQKGFNVEYISPVNEPSWNWVDNPQEGCPYLNTEIKKLVIELDKSISKRKLKTKIFIPESANLKNLYGFDSFIKADKNPKEDASYNQIYAFFDPSSKDYIGNLKTVARKIAGHSYHTHLRNKELVDVRKKVADAVAKYGLEYHQSEWCLMGFHANPTKIDGVTKDWKTKNYTDMQTALQMAKIIYADIVHGKAVSWGYWVATELRDGICALIDTQGFVEDTTKGRDAKATKLLWVLGNYSFFIRPNYSVIELKGADDLNGVFASAYASEDSSKIVAVFVNMKHTFDNVDVKLPTSPKSISIYVTDERHDLTKLYSDKIKLLPRSVTTVVFQMK